MKLSDWMSLARGANLPTLWTNAIAAWAVNAGSGPSLRRMPEWTEMNFFSWTALLCLLLGSSLIYAGGCFFNDACDHEQDRKNRPERPIPQGSVTLLQVWIWGSAQLGLGAWTLIYGAGCSWKWTLALIFCILAYDWLHKVTKWGILLMGGCRTLLWITAGTAASGMSPAPHLIVWACAVGAYVAGISWQARLESDLEKQRTANEWLERIPLLLLFSPPLLALAFLVLWNNLDPVRCFLANLAGLLAGGIVFFAILKIREKKKGSIGKGVSRLLAGICAVDSTALAFHAPLLVGPCILLGGIAHILQKKFAAT